MVEKLYITVSGKERVLAAASSAAFVYHSQWSSAGTIFGVFKCSYGGQNFWTVRSGNPLYTSDIIRTEGQYCSIIQPTKSNPGPTTYKIQYAWYPELTVAAGAGGSVAGSPSGTYNPGDQITITASPYAGYTFSKWYVNGAAYPASQPLVLYINGDMTVMAEFAAIPTYTVNLTLDTADQGYIIFNDGVYGDQTVSANTSKTVYINKTITLKASVYNQTLNRFVGWYSGATLLSDQTPYSFSRSTTTSVSITARFAALPTYTLVARASSGGVYAPGNPAEEAGCSASIARIPDLTSPDRYLAGNIRVDASPAVGWRVASYQIRNVDGGSGNTSVSPFHETYLDFDIAFNAEFIFVFERIPITVETLIHAASAVAFTDVSATNESSASPSSGAEITARYGDTVRFSAIVKPGYIFGGWYDADGVLASSDNPYSVTVGASDIALTAKALAPVKVSTAFSVNATPANGSAAFGDGTAGTQNFLLGGTVTMRATGGYNAIFAGWYREDDPGKSLIPGYTEEITVDVTDALSLVAYFVGTVDLEDRYLAILNYNNNNQAYDPAIGVIRVDRTAPPEEFEEITRAEFETFLGASVPVGDNDVGEAGDRFFKITGIKTAVVSASPAGSLGFMKWTSRYLIPRENPQGGDPNFTLSAPVDIGAAPSINFISNNHYIIDAVWGDPVQVDVRVLFANGNDATMGGFTLPLSESGSQPSDTQNGIKNRYLQGEEIALGAYVGNGYLFTGWFYGADGTSLISTDPNYVFKVNSAIIIYAKFARDANAIYKWEGGTDNKMASWRSKRFVASKPFNPSSARVYADAYPVTLSIFMSSSPDAPSALTPTVSLYARSQDGFRLPMARPEKYIEIELRSQHDVTEAVISTSMEGLAQ